MAGSIIVATKEWELNASIEANVSKTSSGDFYCHLCGSLMKARTSLRRHFFDKHYDDGTIFKCPAPSCEGAYVSRNKLCSHILKYHKELAGIDLSKCKMKR